MKNLTKLALLPALVLAVGCGPSYQEHRVTQVHAAAGGDVPQSTLQVTLPEGAILTANMVPYDTDDEIMENSDVTSDDPTILEVIHVAGKSGTTYAFIGRREGRTTVRYYGENREVRSEPATVSAAR